MRKLALFFTLAMVLWIVLLYSCKKEDQDPVYTKVAVTKFEVSQIPFFKPNGESWEDLPLVEQGPDIYWLVTDANDSVYYGTRDVRFDNVTSAHLPLVRVLSQPLMLAPLNGSWFIKVYDYDMIGGDDLMETIGPFHFNGYDEESTSAITVTGDSAMVKLDIEWRE